jgi:hypothetical protein
MKKALGSIPKQKKEKKKGSQTGSLKREELVAV